MTLFSVPAAVIVLLALCVSITPSAIAQSPTAVAHLDLNQFMGTWYEIARYPVKPEKKCFSDAVILYALGDKNNSFQIVTSCRLKGDNSDSWNAKGKMDKAADGKLRKSRFLFLSSNYWVFATGPAYEWALVGTPNHKSVWVLSRSTALPPEVLDSIKAKAAAEGFDTGKLQLMPQHS